MSTDTKAIIGTIVAANVSLGGLLSAQFAGFNTRIDDLRTAIATVKADHSADNADIRTDLRRMDDRLRAVEIAFGKVDQRSRPWSGSTGRRRQPASRRVVFVPLEVGGAAADADQIDGHASNVSQRMLFGMTGRRRRPAGLTCCRPPARRARNQTWRTSRRVAVAASQRAFSLSMRSSPPRWRAGSRVAPSCPRWSGEKPLSRLPDFLPTSPPTMPISATTSAAWTTACEPSRSPSARSTSASRRFRGDAAGWSRRAGERSVGAAAELRRAMRVGSPFLPGGERRWSPACPRRRGLEAGGRFVHDVDVAGAGQFGGELAGEVRRRHRRTAD